MKLYNYYRSSASYRVRIALNAKGIHYEYIPVHLLNNGGEQYSTDYSKLNPMGQVPTLVDKNISIAQSVAIIEYLDEKYPEPNKLLPYDIEKRALVREFCEIINAGMQPLQNLAVLQTIDKIFKPHESKKTEWMFTWMEKAFHAMESKLAKHSGNFCFGNQLTAADCFLVPQVFSSQRFGFDTTNYANITRVYSHLVKLDYVQKAEPSKQIDA